MEIEQQIQQEAHRARVAFEAFKGLFAATNPPPVEKLFQPENQWIKAALAVVLVASMIVSGSHTIPTFAGGDNLIKSIIGVAGFFMLEVSIVAFEFIRTQRHYRVQREEPATLNMFLKAGLGLALMVLLTVQVEYMLTQGGIVIHDNIRLFILVSMAIGAPLLAFFTGGILAMYSVMDRVQLRRHTEAHDAEMQQWEEELRRVWQANKAKFGGKVQVTVERPSDGQLAGRTADTVMPALSVRTASDGQRTDSGHGYERKANAKDLVRQHLAEHPEDITAQVRELAARLDVGKSTVSDVQREFREKG